MFLWSILTAVEWVLAALSRVGRGGVNCKAKQLRHETDQLSTSIAKVRMSGAVPSLLHLLSWHAEGQLYHDLHIRMVCG